MPLAADWDVRRAGEADLPLLADLEAAADARFSTVGMARLPTSPGTALSDSLFVLVVGRPPVGFCAVGALGGEAHLQQMSVHPAFGRRGFGSALLSAAISLCRDLGFSSLSLTTFSDVPWNAPFYRGHGFTECVPTGELARVRAAEKRRGLDGLGPRQAMVLSLAE